MFLLTYLLTYLNGYEHGTQGVNAEVEIKSGDEITVTIDDQYEEACTKDILWLDYKNLVQVIETGKRILIDDGNLSLIVQEKGRRLCG